MKQILILLFVVLSNAALGQIVELENTYGDTQFKKGVKHAVLNIPSNSPNELELLKLRIEQSQTFIDAVNLMTKEGFKIIAVTTSSVGGMSDGKLKYYVMQKE